MRRISSELTASRPDVFKQTLERMKMTYLRNNQKALVSIILGLSLALTLVSAQADKVEGGRLAHYGDAKLNGGD